MSLTKRQKNRLKEVKNEKKKAELLYDYRYRARKKLTQARRKTK